MAEFARHSGFEVEVATIEAWEDAGRDFDAVIAATAWHWVDPVAGAAKVAQVLRPGGRFAAFWHAPRFPDEVAKAFAYEATRFEGFKIARYDAPEGRFLAHRDNLSPSTRHRRFALTLNLNDGYEGGRLRFPEYGPMLYRPPAGGALLFSCSLLHEVTPLDPWTFCVVPATLVSVAIAASLVPAWRATRIDPVRALRAE